MMARRLSTIAKYINENWPGFTAKVEKSWASTDRKIKGSRLRWPGKGRTGNRLTVLDPSGTKVLDHNAAETYRSNDEVERWIEKVEAAKGGIYDRLKYLPGQEAKRIAWLEKLLANARIRITKCQDDSREHWQHDIDRFEREIEDLRSIEQN